ncbi:hypothetical protein MalM25_15060 [Planctomycetes bacterium MalM25]|nr:hypothetical protein MalM25_15060 [Planctomycetes bacterium MalM25]
MIENLAEKLSQNPRRWLIVTGVTFVLALAIVLPQVDHLIAERSERAELLEQLAQANETAKRLPLYEQRIAEKASELAGLRDREIDDDEVAELRTWLVDAARQAGCRVRRIELSNPNERSWTDDDHPLSTPTPAKSNAKTPFRLRTRPVAFSVTGSSDEVMALLRTIDEDTRLKHTRTLDLKPVGRKTNELQLDLTLWFFALSSSQGVA